MKKWNGVGSPRDMAGWFVTDELDFAVVQTKGHQNLREQYPASNACSMMDESGRFLAAIRVRRRVIPIAKTFIEAS